MEFVHHTTPVPAISIDCEKWNSREFGLTSCSTDDMATTILQQRQSAEKKSKSDSDVLLCSQNRQTRQSKRIAPHEDLFWPFVVAAGEQ